MGQTVAYSLSGIFGIIFTSIVVMVVGRWFSSVYISYLKVLFTELVFLAGIVMIELLLVFIFSALGIPIDFAAGLPLIQWIVVVVTGFVFILILGGGVFSLILPVNFGYGLLVCLISHLFAFSLFFVLMMVLTDIRIQLPIKRPPIEIYEPVEAVPSVDIQQQDPELTPTIEKQKTLKIVNRAGFKSVPIASLKNYRNRTIRYQLPNGVRNKGVLLNVKRDLIEIKQSKRGGSFTYTVLIKELRKVEVYGVWQEKVYQ